MEFFFIIIGFVINNIIWMYFTFLFIPERKIQKKVILPQVKLHLPKIPLTKPRQSNEADFDNVATGKISAREVLKNMRQ